MDRYADTKTETRKNTERETKREKHLCVYQYTYLYICIYILCDVDILCHQNQRCNRKQLPSMATLVVRAGSCGEGHGRFDLDLPWQDRIVEECP